MYIYIYIYISFLSSIPTSWLIQRQSQSCREAEEILFDLIVGGIKMFMLFPRVLIYK